MAEKIKFTLSPEEIKKINTNPEGTFKQKEVSPYGDVTGIAKGFGEEGAISPTLEAKGISYNPVGISEDIAMEKAIKNQTVGDILRNMVVGGGKQALAGAILNAGGNWLPGTIQMAAGIEGDSSNPLQRFAMKILQDAQTKNAILQDPHATSRIFNPEYIAQQGQSLGLTVGIVGEAGLEQLLFNTLTAGVAGPESLVLGAGKVAKTLSQVNKLNKIKNYAFGGFQGIKEANMNALFTADEVRQKYRELGGYTEEEIEKLAEETATKAFRLESLPMILLNGLQYGAFGHYNVFKGSGNGFTTASGAFEDLGTGLTKTFNLGKKASKVAEFGIQTGSESFEETYQNAISQYSQYKTDLEQGVTGDKTLSDYLWNNQMVDEAIGGALGGMLFSVLGKGMSRIGAVKSGQKYFNKGYDQLLKSSVDNASDNFVELKAAIDSGNGEAVTIARNDMNISQSAIALRWDKTKGSEDTHIFNNRVDQMESILSAAKSQDTETLKKFGITEEEDIDFVLNNYQNFINDALAFKEALNKNAANSIDYDSAEALTQYQFIKKSNVENLAKAKARIAEVSMGANLAALPSELVRYASVKAELDALQGFSLTESQRSRKAELEKQYEGLKTENFDPENLTQTQKEALEATPEIESLNKVSKTIVALEKAIGSNNSNIAKLSSVEGQVTRKKDRIQKEIDNINNIKSEEGLDRLLGKINEAGMLTSEIKNKVESRKTALRAEKIASKGTKVKPSTITSQTIEDQKQALQDKVKLAEEEKQRLLEERRKAALARANEALEDAAPNEEEAAAINNVLGRVEPPTTTGDSFTVTEEDIFSFPKPVFATDEGIKGEFKDSVASVIRRAEESGAPIDNFRKLLSHYIKINTQGTEKAFNYLVEAWKANGKTLEESADKIYDDFFSNAKDLALLNKMETLGEEGIITEQLNATETDVKSSNEKSEATIYEEENDDYVEEGTSTSNSVENDQTDVPTPKIPFLGVKYKVVSDGKGGYYFETVEEGLNRGGQTLLDKILNFKIFNKGTKFDIKVKSNWMQAKVQKWEVMLGGKLTASVTTMEEWLLAKEVDGKKLFTATDLLGAESSLTHPNWTAQQQEVWLSKVPMDMFDKQGNNIGSGVHDTEWWNVLNTASFDRKYDKVAAEEAQKRLIIKGRKEVMRIRKNVLMGNTEMIVTSRKSGHSSSIPPTEKLRTISSENPTGRVSFVSFAKKEVTVRNPKGGVEIIPFSRIINAGAIDATNNGKAHVLTEVDVVDGEMQYMLTMVVTDFEDFQDGFDNLVSSLKIVREAAQVIQKQQMHLEYDKEAYTKAIELKNKILKETDIDISTFVDGKNTGINKIMSLYARVGYKYEKDTVTKDAKGNVAPATTLYTRANGKPHYALLIQASGFKKNYFPIFSKDEKGNVTMQNYHSDILNEDGYEAYLKDHLVTNKAFYKIEDENGKPMYVAHAQPILNYDVVNKEVEVKEEEEEEKVPVTPVAPTIPVTPKVEEKPIIKEPITTLTYEQKQRVVKYLIHNILSSFKSSDITYSQIVKELSGAFDKYLAKVKDNPEYAEEYKYLLENKDSFLGIGKYAKTPGTVREQVGEMIGEEIRETDIVEDTTIEGENPVSQEGLISKGLDASSFEYNVKNSLSARLKRLLCGIPRVESKSSLGEFAGLEEYYSPDVIFDTLQRLLSDTPNTLENLFGRIDAKLKQNPKNFEFLKELKERLQNSDKQIQKEFLFKLNQTKNDMFLVLVKEEKEGFSLQTLNANSKEPVLRLQREFESNFESSDLVDRIGEGYQLNIEEAEKVKNIFANWIKKGDKNAFTSIQVFEVKQWLDKFGITVSEKTLEDLKNIETGADAFSGRTWNTLFIKGGLLYRLNESVEQIGSIKKNVLNFNISNENVIRRNNIKGYLKDLAVMEINNTIVMASCMKIAGKNVMTYSQPNFASEQTRKLRDKNNPLLQKLMKSSFSKHSMMLKLLTTEDESGRRFRKIFEVSYIGIQGMKKGKNKDHMGATEMSPSDFDIMLNAFFSFPGNTVGEENGIELQSTKMAFPPLSDSSQMFLVDTAKLVLKLNNFVFDKDSISIEDNVLEVLFNQLVLPDLQRITDYLTAKREGSVTSNIEGHTLGSQIFTIIPELNTLDIDGASLIDIIHNSVTKFGKSVPESLQFTDKTVINEDMKKKIKDSLQTLILDNVNSKIKTIDGQVSGDWVKEDIVRVDAKKTVTSVLDHDYLKKTGASTIEEQLKVAALDYVINNYIHQAQLQMLFAGDMANYCEKPKKLFKDLGKFQGKDAAEKFFNKMNSLTTQEREKAYIDYMKMTSVNFFKRMKEQLSPGNRIADSKDKQYTQVIVNDKEDSSGVLGSLIKLWYPKTYTEHKDKIATLKNLEIEINKVKEQVISEERTAKIKELSTKIDSIKKILREAYPEILGGKSNYLDIDYTDGQEFTTWKEHLHILYNEGRISEVVFESATKKLTSQSKDGVNESNKLSKDEKSLIFQPIKPLHAGMYFTPNGNYVAQRFVYVKTSSFPLIPEMTEGISLDNIRKNIEKYETVHNSNVRVTYKSGIKVGAMEDSMDVEELYNLDESVQERIESSSIVLDRDNFSIQQDKPFKTDKHVAKNQEDSINRGTQIDKILMGNGINKITERIFDNMFDAEVLKELGIDVLDKLTGVELYKICNYLSMKEQEAFRRSLFEELGVDENTDWYNVPETLEKIQDLLDNRLSNYQDRAIIQLKYRVVEGNVISYYTKEELKEKKLKASGAEFNVPLWISPNSQKFESVLNSIINNRTVKLSLPGGSSPVASQEGFTKREESSLTEEEKSGIIYTENYDGESLKATHYDTQGKKMKTAQVLLPCKIRHKVKDANGRVHDELIDVRDYTKVVNGRTVLDFDKIDPEILQMFSFRIPTSSHQSASAIEVVGFLPHSMGDTMIVPKDHVTQIGEDFDIDVRYYYKQNTYEDSTGKIRRLRLSDIPTEESREQKNKLYTEYREMKDKFIEESKGYVNEIWRDNMSILYSCLFAESELKTLQANTEFDTTEQQNELKEEISFLRGSLLSTEGVKKRQGDLKAELNEQLAKLDSLRDEDVKKIDENYITSKGLEKMRQRVIENNLVALYKSIFSTSNAAVQKKISAVLSTDFAASTANTIAKVAEASNYNPHYSIYDDRVQKDALRLGASGKLGIGVHSNWVVFNSLMEQLEKPLRIMTEVGSGDYKPSYFKMVLGKLISNGYLGTRSTLDGNRSIAVVNMENQNCSTDNQKLQIMGKRNENKYTINEFALLCNLGFDIGVLDNGTEVHIPSLFISQPIIKRYTELRESYDSLFSDYTPNAEEEITAQLKKEFGDGVRFYTTDEGVETSFMEKDTFDLTSDSLTAQALLDNLSSKDNAQQWAVYQKFIQLTSSTKSLTKTMQALNIEKDGLGISFFNTIDKKDNLIFNLNEDTLKIEGVDALFGERVVIKADEDGKELLEKGFIFVYKDDEQAYYMRPTTAQNAKIINTLSIGYNLWKNVFPFEDQFIVEQISTITGIAGVNEGTSKEMELKYKILSSMKDFIYAFKNSRLFNNVVEDRKKLVIDSATNMSLARKLNELKKRGNVLFEQPFFKDLDFNIFTDGVQPSIMKYSVNSSSSIDKNAAYSTLQGLVGSQTLVDSSFLGEYTYNDLVRELTQYALLSDQENGAIGFRNYIPMEAFEEFGVNTTLKRIATSQSEVSYFNYILNGEFRAVLNLTGSKYYDELEGIIEDRRYDKRSVAENTHLQKLINMVNSTYGDGTMVWNQDTHQIFITNLGRDKFDSLFVEQYFQHNPEDAAKINWRDRKTLFSSYSNTENPEKATTFTLKEKNNAPAYYAIKKPKSSDYVLFKHVGNGIYNRITTLGGLGMNEYSPLQTVEKSLYKGNAFDKGTKTSTFTIQGDNPIKRTLTATDTTVTIVDYLIQNSKNESVRKLLEALKPYIKSNPIKVIAKEGLLRTGFEGVFVVEHNSGERFIHIDPSFTQDISTDKFQTVFLEEFVHSLTAEEIHSWVKSSKVKVVNGKLVFDIVIKEDKKDIPQPYYITKFINLYKEGVTALILDYMNKNNVTLEQAVEKFNTQKTETDYRASSIEEFIAGIFVTPEFRSVLDKTPYKGGGTLYEQFKNIVKSIMIKLTKGQVSDSITEHTIDAIFAQLNKIQSVEMKEKLDNALEGETVKDALELLKTPTKEVIIKKSIVTTAKENYSRQIVKNNPRTLYIFTDNTDRDSGSSIIPSDTAYSIKYGTGHHYPSMTTAMIRGMENSRPISTQRWYHTGAKGNAGRWNDADIKEFSSVIDDEINEIKKAWATGNYDNIIIPAGDGFFNSKISNISIERTPKLYNYLKTAWGNLEKELEVKTFKVEDEPITSMESITNHSGGAYGADTMWDIIGRRFGVTNHRHYREGSNTGLSQKLKNSKVVATIVTKEQMDIARVEVERLLGKKFPDTLQGNLQVRNYYQVANSDGVFAIATLTTDNKGVTGGTNTAVQLGISLGKPVYVWDTTTEKWNRYNTTSEQFEISDTPILTKNFAGVGTRNIENYNILDKESGKWIPRKEYLGIEKEKAAAQAIKDVYQKTQDSISKPIKESSNLLLNKDGKPLVIYRGYAMKEDREATSLEETIGGTAMDYIEPGFYFSENKEEAKEYGEVRTDKGSSRYDLKTGEEIPSKHYTGDYAKVSAFNISAPNGVLEFKDILAFRKAVKEGKVPSDLTGYAIKLLTSTLGNPNNPEWFVKDKNQVTLIPSKKEEYEQHIDAEYQYYGAKYSVIVVNGVAVLVNNYKGKAKDMQKILDAYNANPDIDIQNGKKFRNFSPQEKVASEKRKESDKPYFVFRDGVVIETDFWLNIQQSEALQKMADFLAGKEGFFTLKGYAGTGKTSTVRYLTQYFKQLNPYTTVLFSSPTHRANTVLKSNLEEDAKVVTLHKAFGLSPQVDLEEFSAADAKFIQANGEQINRNSVLIIDESSMINQELFDFITKASKDLGVKVIFMGDPAQLSPVKSDTLSPVFSTEGQGYELTKVERTGDNPLLAEVTHIRNSEDEEVMTLQSSQNAKGEGVTFMNNGPAFSNKVVELFRSLDFKNNPLFVRVITGTNAKVLQINTMIRNAIFGEASKNDYNEGELLMGYNNFDTDSSTKEPKIQNSGDYIVKSVSDESKMMVGNVEATYVILSLRSVAGDSKKVIDIKMLSKNNPQSVFDEVGAEFERLRMEAMQAVRMGVKKGEAWKPFFTFQKSFATPVDILYKGTLKIKKTLDYGYAHTIHKSQGGTYNYVVVDTRDLVKFQDKQTVKQLKYVALSRAKTHAYVLTDKEISVDTPKVEDEVSRATGTTPTFTGRPNFEEIYTEGRILVQGLYLTLEEYNSMSEEEQENFKNCL